MSGNPSVDTKSRENDGFDDKLAKACKTLFAMISLSMSPSMYDTETQLCCFI